MVLEEKSSQEYPVNAEVPQGSILALHFSSYALTALKIAAGQQSLTVATAFVTTEKLS